MKHLKSLVLLAIMANASVAAAATQSFDCQSDQDRTSTIKFQLTTAAAPITEQPSSEVPQAKKYLSGAITAMTGIPNTNALTGELKLRCDRFDVESGTVRYRSKTNGADVFSLAVNPGRKLFSS